MAAPKVSIIVPVYNTERYLKKCLDSLVAQTLSDIEIICVNDGSTDASAQILGEFTQKDARVRVITQENQGLSAARNAGMAAAQGEYIGFVDSDDWVAPEMFKKLYENAQKYDSDVAMCSFTTVNQKNGEHCQKDPYMTLDLFDESFERRAFSPAETFDFIFRIPVCAWNKIYKRELINAVKFPAGLFFEDNVFFLETYLKARKISIIKEPLYFYRVNQENSIVSGAYEKKIDFFKVFELSAKILKEKGAWQKLKKYFKAHKKDSLIYWYNKIQAPAVKNRYFKKLVAQYPSFLFYGLENKIKMKIMAHKLKNILKTKRVVFWGASLFLKEFLERFGEAENIAGVVDKSSNRRGEDFCGYKIISPDELREFEFDALIPSVINIANFDKIVAGELRAIKINKPILNLFGVYIKTDEKINVKAMELIAKLQNYFPKDTVLMFDFLNEDNTECIDTYSLFLYSQENPHVCKFKYKYAINVKNPLYKKLKKENKLKNVIPIKHNDRLFFIETFFTLLRAKIVISSFGYKWNSLLKNNEKIAYVYTDHGVVFLKNWVFEFQNQNNFNYYIASSEREKKLMLEQKCFEEKSIIKSSLPRWELLKKDSTEKNIFVMFTWRTSFGKNSFENFLYFKRIQEFLNNSELNRLLSKNNIKLKFTLHHTFCTEGINIKIGGNIEFVPMTNISEHIGKTSLFITDYSSICFDFMFLDIPVIFYRLDFDDEKLNSKDLSAAVWAKNQDEYLYNCTYSLEDCLEKIKYYIENNFELEEKYKKINEEFSYSKKQRGTIRKELIKKLELL